VNHRFIEGLFRTRTNIWGEQDLSYTVSGFVPPFSPYKQLSANVFADNCIGTQTFADMGRFDLNNVMTN